MKCFKMIERLIRIDKLIRNERTGSPTEFANRLGISRSHMYHTLNELKELGAPIVYSKNLNSFHYLNDFKIEIDFKVRILNDDECFNIAGGIGGMYESEILRQAPTKFELSIFFLDQTMLSL